MFCLLRVLERPIRSASQLVSRTGLSMPAVNSGLATLQKLGAVRELTGRKRNRVFSYAPYVRILSEGTQPI